MRLKDLLGPVTRVKKKRRRTWNVAESEREVIDRHGPVVVVELRHPLVVPAPPKNNYFTEM